MEDVEAFYAELEIAGFPKRYTHNMGDYQVLRETYSCFLELPKTPLLLH